MVQTNLNGNHADTSKKAEINSYTPENFNSNNRKAEYQRRLIILTMSRIETNGRFKYPPFKEKINTCPPDNPQELFTKIIGLVKEKSQTTGKRSISANGSKHSLLVSVCADATG